MKVNSSNILRSGFVAVLITILIGCAPSTPTAEAPNPSAEASIVGADATASAPTEAAKPPSILRIAHDTDVQSNVDPHAIQGYQINWLENMYEHLAYPSRDTLEIRPELAESYEVSEDGKFYTFKLRRNVKFHDGSFLDAETVKLSFERMMDMGQAIGQDELNKYVVNITTPDDYTVVFEVDPGGVPFLAVQTSVLIVSSKAIKENRTDADPWATEYFAQHEAGTGPYQLEELRPKDLMRIVKFGDYWGGWEGEHVDEADWLEVPEGVTQALMLERGELDVSFEVPEESIPSMQDNPNLQILESRGNYVFYLRMNNHAGPLVNKTLRQAFAYAFDYESFNEADPGWFPPEGPVPAALLGDWTPPNLPKYDIEKAKELYAEAGYGPDNPLKIDQVILSGYDDQAAAAQILQQGLSELGVEYEISTGEFAPIYTGLLKSLREDDQSGFHDMFALRYPILYPDPVTHLTPYRMGRDHNFMGYSNPEVDALIEEALANPDQDMRTDLYRQAVELIVDDSPDIWLGVERRRVVLSAAVQGFYFPPIWWPAIRVYPISLSN